MSNYVDEWTNDGTSDLAKLRNMQRRVDEDRAVVRPAHYTKGNVECIDAMVAAFGIEDVTKFAVINAFKYLYRHEEKDKIRDLKKAIWYLQFAIGDDPRGK